MVVQCLFLTMTIFRAYPHLPLPKIESNISRFNASLSLAGIKSITPIPLRVSWPWEAMDTPASLLPELSPVRLEPECKGICTLSRLFRALGWEKWAWPFSFCEHDRGCLKLTERLGTIFCTRFLRVLGLHFTTSERGASLSGLNQKLKHFGVKQKPPPGPKK